MIRKLRRQALGAGPSIIFHFGLAVAGVWGLMPRACSAEIFPKAASAVHANPGHLAQNDDGDTPEVAPVQIENYVAVYAAMQRDRGLTVEQAAMQRGMSLQAFRQLENRIERNDAAREQARKQLQQAASESASPAPSPASSLTHPAP